MLQLCACLLKVIKKQVFFRRRMARGGVVRLSKLSKSTIAYALSLLQIKILLMLFFTRLIEFRLFWKGLIFIAPVQSSCGSQPSQMSKCISNSDKSTPEAFFNTNNVNFPWSVKWGGSKTCKATTVALLSHFY